MRAGDSRHGLAQVLAGSDDGFFPAIAQKAQHRFDLWSHVAWREMSGVEVALQFGGGDLASGRWVGFL